MKLTFNTEIQAMNHLFNKLNGATLHMIENNETKSIRFYWKGNKFRWNWNCGLVEWCYDGILRSVDSEVKEVKTKLGIS
jgi:hypothetical protein